MLPALCLALATRLAADGVARVDSVLPAALAADVRAVALAAAVGAPRQEVPLSLKIDAVASAMATVVASPVGRALEESCGGDAPLCVIGHGFGAALDEASTPFELRHQACSTCYLYGAFCLNPTAVLSEAGQELASETTLPPVRVNAR